MPRRPKRAAQFWSIGTKGRSTPPWWPPSAWSRTTPACAGREVATAATPYLDTRLPSIGSAEEGPLKVAGKPEIREYKAMFVVGDQEIGIFSHELVVNCAP